MVSKSDKCLIYKTKSLSLPSWSITMLLSSTVHWVFDAFFSLYQLETLLVQLRSFLIELVP